MQRTLCTDEEAEIRSSSTIFPRLKEDNGIYMHTSMVSKAISAPRSPHGHLDGHLDHFHMADGSLDCHIPVLLPTRVSGHMSPLSKPEDS